FLIFFFSSRRRHTRSKRDWSSDVCSSDLRLLLFGIIINCFGSVIGFVGHSFFSLLIMARFIQGAGAAAFPALVMVVVARYIPKENRGKAFGLIGSIVAMGEGVGPAIG